MVMGYRVSDKFIGRAVAYVLSILIPTDTL